MKKRISWVLALLGAAALAPALGCSSSSSATTAGSCTGTGTDTDDLTSPPISCAYNCPNDTCAEQTTAYACPALASWSQMPHDPACGCWDGTYPKVVTGQCTASAPTGEAIKYAGPDGDQRVLPDGRRIHPAGGQAIFATPVGGLTSGLTLIPGTKLALTVDTGMDDHVVRLVDTAVVGLADPVKSSFDFIAPETLNSEIVVAGPDLAFVGTDDGVVQAIRIDVGNNLIARDDARSIKLPASMNPNGDATSWYVAGVAVSPDRTKLVVTGVTETKLLVYDLTAGATFGKLLGQVDLGASETYQARFDPNDPAGQFVYVSIWGSKQVAEVSLANPAAPSVTRKFATDKDPEGLAFLDARWMVVANDLGDTVSLVDRVASTVTSVAIDVSLGVYGLEPSGLAYDGANHRLYVTLAGINAIGAYDVSLSTTPPTLNPLGRLPAAWWPGAVAVADQGALVVASMRGYGSGPSTQYSDIGNSDIGDRMHGGVQVIPFPSATDLASGEAEVAKDIAVAKLDGYPTVTCPAGVNDFPMPPTNSAASPVIDHVFFFVRENKDFDGLFGDFPNANGDASLTLKQDSGAMDKIWKNLRSLSRTFAMSDNYYTDAVYSTQGHVWTTYGRTNDFNERTWITSGNGRNARPIPGGGVLDVGEPVEGSLFDWLGANNVDFDILGEIDGSPQKRAWTHNPIDIHYPGGPFQNIGFNDLQKACYFAARERGTCSLGNFTYATLPNDHTFGVSPTNPSPETFCAVNDEATGMVIDAISHSPLWKSSVIFITEDDPSQGGDHVDTHRAPLVVISPWVKHGYVSHTHIDVASVHKMFAHVLGKPYPNFSVESAGIPFDMFTSTPDFAPYTYQPRGEPLSCGVDATRAEQSLTQSWDFSDADEQPGLDEQVTRYMRGHQLTVLSGRQQRGIERRTGKKMSDSGDPTDDSLRTSVLSSKADQDDEH